MNSIISLQIICQLYTFQYIALNRKSHSDKSKCYKYLISTEVDNDKYDKNLKHFRFYINIIYVSHPNTLLDSCKHFCSISI